MANKEIGDDTLWQAVSSELLAWIELDGEFVAYHRPSGKTHFLNHSSKQLLEALGNSPLSTSAVVAAYSDLVDDGAAASVAEDIGELLEQFEELGLLERCGTS